MPRLTPLLALATALLAASTLPAQQPTILHAQLTTESAAKGLGPRLEELKHAGTPLWAGYSIPVEPGVQHNDDENHPALLEGGNRGDWHGTGEEKFFDHANVLLRIANNTIEKIRIENPTRSLDAGNLRFVWLNDVAESDSIRTFTALARDAQSTHLAETAVFLVGMHRSQEATTSLIALAAPSNPFEIREKAAFWLANRRGKEGFDAIRRMAREDADPKFREKLTFDLTLTKEPGGLDEIIRMAHSDSAQQVRKQAQFWMAVKGGKKVAGDLRNLAENDPDTQLRKSAVFALSRLPNEEAATQLIAVANSSKDPAVRKQAVFWLGQSQDPRALDYLTNLLKQ